MSRPRDAAQGRAGSRTSARTISSAATPSRGSMKVGPSEDYKARRVGRTGSTDRLILRLHRGGIYVSIRLYGMRGLWAAFGPTYVNRAGLRP